MILARLRRELAKQAREFARPERRVRSLGKSVYYLGENRRILRRFFSPRITLIDANSRFRFREAFGVRHVFVSLWIEPSMTEKRCEDARTPKALRAKRSSIASSVLLKAKALCPVIQSVPSVPSVV